MRDFSRKPKERLRIYADRGLIPRIPTLWQLILGQLEMGPYVTLPDEGDDERYAGTRFGHPLLRSPIIFAEIGLDHLRVGHGLHAKPESLYRHLNFVYHEGMPVYDLQLVQTIPGGLGDLRTYIEDIEFGRTAKARSQQKRIDWIIPSASEYRQNFLGPDGWIAQCERFQYPEPEAVAGFLRPEFFSLIRFANYCANAFESKPKLSELPFFPLRARELFTRATRGYRPPREETPGLDLA